MKIFQLSLVEVASRLKHPGLYFETGPFVIHLQTSLSKVAEGVRLLYRDFALAESSGFADFHVSLERPRNLRRWFRPQVRFLFDGESAFAPLPLNQAIAVLEAGLNWCIYSNAHQYLMIHAAAVERNGFAAMLPAPPGSGKSTLCAALVNRGWRLLTDELTLLDRETRRVVPLARPISLKNESIELMRKFVPQATFGPEISNTVKGTIAHMRPPAESVAQVRKSVLPRWLIFPRYERDAPISIRPLLKARAFSQISGSLVNYTMQGIEGFEILSALIEGIDCYELKYSDLDEAITWFGSLITSKASFGRTQEFYANSA